MLFALTSLAGTGCHEFHVILDTLGPDGVWVGVAPPNMDPTKIVGDSGCGWALHSDGDKRFDGKEEVSSVNSHACSLFCSIVPELTSGIALFAGVHSSI